MINRMDGCRISPLSSYLKALGVIKIIGEQIDRNAKFFWTNQIFYVESEFSKEYILDFIINKYSPSPIMDPWNKGSLFYAKAEEKLKMDEIRNSANERFKEIRFNYEIIQKTFPALKGGIDKTKVGEMVSTLRSKATDRYVEWLDTSILVSSEGETFFPPLMGTGGNEGHLDYAKFFMMCVWELLVNKNRKEDEVMSLLRNSLFGEDTRALIKHSFGKFDPSRAGGANQGNGISTENFKVNYWDFVFLMEGSLLWSNDIGRRSNYGKGRVLSPFTVEPSYVGFTSALKMDSKHSEKEIWSPIWSNKASLCEIKKFFAEGRVDIYGNPPRNGLEFSEAINSLGTDRGISGFNRYLVLTRRGQASIAIDAGYFSVKDNKYVNLLRDVSKYKRYLKNLNKNKLIITSKMDEIQRRLDQEEFELTMKGSQESVMRFIREIGRSYEEIMSRLDDKSNGSIKQFFSEEWVKSAWDDSVEFFLALSLVTLKVKGNDISDMVYDVFRNNRTPKIEIKIKDLLLSLARENSISERRNDRMYSAIEISLGYVNKYLDNNIDWRKFKDLLFALMLVRFSRDQHMLKDLSSRQENDDALFIFPTSRTFYTILLSTRVDKNSARIHGGGLFSEKLLRLLEAGRIDGAFNFAKRMLMSNGYFLLDFENNIPDSVNCGVRMASALVFPIKFRDWEELVKF